MSNGFMFDTIFKTLFTNWGPTAIGIRTGFVLLLAAQLTTREEYHSPDDYVTSVNRGQYLVEQCNSTFCGFDIDNACRKTVRGTPLVFDFIVVGSGAGGSTLARQLLDSPGNWTVLLVEAGGDQKTESVVPRFFQFTFNGTNVWNQTAQVVNSSSNAFKNGTPMFFGKQLGGSTATNVMMYVCGNDRDYNGWADMGNTGWDYDSVLPYIKKSEGNTDSTIVGDGTYHATSGNLTVTSFPAMNPIISILEQGVQELGYSKLLDYNAGQYNGIVRLQSTIRGGERCSSYRAFIAPVKDNKNLYIMKHSQAVKINFNGTTATGVTVHTNNTDCPVINLEASKEVIISAGSLGTPKLLQLSGIGRKEDLEPFGIKQIKDLNVGQNLMDHVYSINFFTVDTNSTPATSADGLAPFKQYYYNRTGPLSFIDTANVNSFINTMDTKAKYPDVQLVPSLFGKNQAFLAETLANFGYKDEFIAHIVEVNKQQELFMFFVVVLQPHSRGSVKLRSTDPTDLPVITSGYYSEVNDVHTQLRGINKLLELMNTTALKSVAAKPLKMPIPECDPLPFPSDAYWKCYIKYFSANLWHPSGTSKMGESTDCTAVVSPKLKVHGFDNLRVVDASVMPMITSGNTQCTTYMIAQKAADMIKDEWAEKY